MRKSVAAKRAAEQQKIHEHHNRHKRIAMWLLVPLAASLAMFALSFTNWLVSQQINRNSVQIKNDQREALAYAKLAKINAARNTETTARTEIEAEITTTNKTERTIAASRQVVNANLNDCATKNVSDIGVLINKNHCFSPNDWEPDDLTDVNGYPMRKEAAKYMNDMFTDSAAAGVTMNLSSTYRSYADQRTVYDDWVKTGGSTDIADIVSARPGYSEHQTGLAADFIAPGCVLECFAGTPAYTWLKTHAADYGYINRYPSGLSDITGYAPEPWHWRYVGIIAAKDMKSKGIQAYETYVTLQKNLQ